MGADPSLCFRADPEPKPGTHIFVVGVSRYRHARDGAAPTPFESYGIGQLTTAASSAAKVAAWFRSRFCNPVAPIASIRLLLSPHATEEQTIATLWGGLPPPARKREVATALNLWQRDLNGDRSSIGVLYGVGHGLAADPETPVLLLEDFAAEPRVFGHSFNVGHAHRALGETAASRQFFFVDICQSQAERYGIEKGDGELVVDRHPAERRQTAPLIYSSSPSGKAHAVGGESIFARALIDALDHRAAASWSDGTWCVTTHSLTGSLERDVDHRARLRGYDQHVAPRGLLRNAVLHVLDRPPPLPVRIALRPRSYSGQVRARLLAGNGFRVEGETDFARNPYENLHPPGLYLMMLRSAATGGPEGPAGMWANEVPDGIDGEVTVR